VGLDAAQVQQLNDAIWILLDSVERVFTTKLSGQVMPVGPFVKTLPHQYGGTEG